MDATLTSKGQTTVPKKIRQHLGIGPGDRIRFAIEPDGTVTLVAATLPITALRGAARHPGKTASLAEMEEAIRTGAARGLDRR